MAFGRLKITVWLLCAFFFCGFAEAGALDVPARAATGAAAPANRVVLARPVDADPVTLEVLARVSGELGAAGFEILVVPIRTNLDRRTAVESIGRDVTPLAAFAIFPGVGSPGTPATAEIWVSDRLKGVATVQRLLVEPGDADKSAAVLAVQAVELLKASLAERWFTAQSARDEDEGARRTVARVEQPSSGRDDPALVTMPSESRDSPGADSDGLVSAWSRPALVLDAAVLSHPVQAAGFPSSVAPLLRFGFGLSGPAALRVGLFALGETVSVANEAGSARLAQQMAFVDLVVNLFRGRWFQIDVIGSAGGYRLSLDGDGTSPWIGQHKVAWAGMAGVGPELVVPLAEHWLAHFQVQALGFAPRPVVRIGPAEVSQAGLPSILLSAGIAARL